MKWMRILGIDPGIGIVGFGVIDVTSLGVYENPEWGVITTSKDKSDGARLQEIYEDLTSVLHRYQPDVVSVEQIFFFKNMKTMVPVTQARGVVLLAVHTQGIPYAEYTPMQVKQAITGSGKAKKREVQEMVAQILVLGTIPRPDDAADGLGLALCHHQHSRMAMT